MAGKAAILYFYTAERKPGTWGSLKMENTENCALGGMMWLWSLTLPLQKDADRWPWLTSLSLRDLESEVLYTELRGEDR